MLFPFADDNPTERTPVVTFALIAANVAVFVLQMLEGTVLVSDSGVSVAMPGGVLGYGAIPAAITGHEPPAGSIPPWATLLTCTFLHAGWAHVLANMWFLWIFGNNVEDRMGRAKFILFYAACGVAATLTHVAFSPESQLPLVGASGAVSGVMAAYVVLFPQARVRSFVFVVFFVTVVALPAWLFLGIHFVTNIWLGMDALRSHSDGGVAYLAHVGGYAAGFVLVFVLTPRRDWFRGPSRLRAEPSWAEQERD